MRKHKARKIFTLKKMAILAIIFIGITIVSINQYKRQIGPNIDAISQLKAKGMITEIINESIQHNFSGAEYEENLFKVTLGKDEKIQMVQPNTAMINNLVAAFSERLQKKYDTIEEKTVRISYGTLLGSKILSQLDINVGIKMLPLSVSKCDFETEFETQGINQTKYRIYIVIESNVRVLEPFSSSNFKIKNKMLIAETVIIGEVPSSYVVVPEEDILDVTDE